MELSARVEAPRVSVVMAVYNGARYLPQAIESILAQTLADFEFVIVDDGSTDETPRLLESYRDARIVRLRNAANVGLTPSLNLGMRAARGAYIARQDADDISYPARLEQQMRFLDAHPAVAVVSTLTHWLNAHGEVERVWPQPLADADIQCTLLRYCCLIHGSVLLRRAAVLHAGGYDQRLRTGQDYDLWLRLAEGWQFATLPQVLYAYRKHEGMASATRSAEQRENAHAALIRAHARRGRWGWSGVSTRDLPAGFPRLTNAQRAARYVAWSAGSREFGRGRAALYLLYALLLEPRHPLIRAYVRGIVRRKLHLGGTGTGEFPSPAAWTVGAEA